MNLRVLIHKMRRHGAQLRKLVSDEDIPPDLIEYHHSHFVEVNNLFKITSAAIGIRFHNQPCTTVS
jgi:hypothetical protein